MGLRAMPTRWWGMHKENCVGWKKYRRMMKLRFGYANTRMTEKYNGKDDPHDHLARWTKVWGKKPQPEWVHILCHTLNTTPMN